MRRETARRGSSICAAAATAVSAVGFSLASASMLPAAHAACEDWTLGPTVWEIVLDNGAQIETYGWSGKSMTKTPGGKPAFAEGKGRQFRLLRQRRLLPRKHDLK